MCRISQVADGCGGGSRVKVSGDSDDFITGRTGVLEYERSLHSLAISNSSAEPWKNPFINQCIFGDNFRDYLSAMVLLRAATEHLAAGCRIRPADGIGRLMMMFGLSCLLVPSALSFHASAHLARVLPSRAGAAISMSGDRIPAKTGPSSTVSGNDVTGIGVSKQLHGAVVTTQAGQTVEVLAPGIVIVRGALSESEQKFILHETNKLGSRDVNGFATSGTNGRGRLYEQCKVVPDEFTDLAIQSSLIASASDAAMPACSPTHVLINKYSTSAGLLWHRTRGGGPNTHALGYTQDFLSFSPCPVTCSRVCGCVRLRKGDIYSNDGDGDMPVINLSVGASCKFGISLPIRGAELSESRYLQLHSGDAIIFGGPSRFIESDSNTLGPFHYCLQSYTLRSVPRVSTESERHSA